LGSGGRRIGFNAVDVWPLGGIVAGDSLDDFGAGCVYCEYLFRLCRFRKLGVGDWLRDNSCCGYISLS